MLHTIDIAGHHQLAADVVCLSCPATRKRRNEYSYFFKALQTVTAKVHTVRMYIQPFLGTYGTHHLLTTLKKRVLT